MKKIPALSISLAAVLLTLSALPGFRTPVGAAPPATPGAPSQPAAGKTVVLTFDDAAASHRTVVAPLLKKYGLGGTFFVCEFRGFENKEHYMSWEQIRELSEMGFEIGNHTRSHPAMSKLDREQIEEQIRYIEDKCAQYGIPHPTTFAYPFGKYNDVAREVLASLGFTVMMTCNEGVNVLRKGETERLSYIRRYNRSGRYSTRDFLDRIARDEKKARESL